LVKSHALVIKNIHGDNSLETPISHRVS
jgi:hypothetical protein